MPAQGLSVIILVLARPWPISRLAVRWAVVITLVPLQPHCARVVGVHVEGVVPFAIAASRYVHVAARLIPHANGVVAT